MSYLVADPEDRFSHDEAHILVDLATCLQYTPQGSPGVGRNTFLSSPHLCFIIVFICDLFVSRDDPLMS